MQTNRPIAVLKNIIHILINKSPYCILKAKPKSSIDSLIKNKHKIADVSKRKKKKKKERRGGWRLGYLTPPPLTGPSEAGFSLVDPTDFVSPMTTILFKKQKRNGNKVLLPFFSFKSRPLLLLLLLVTRRYQNSKTITNIPLNFSTTPLNFSTTPNITNV